MSYINCKYISPVKIPGRKKHQQHRRHKFQATRSASEDDEYELHEIPKWRDFYLTNTDSYDE